MECRGSISADRPRALDSVLFFIRISFEPRGSLAVPETSASNVS